MRIRLTGIYVDDQDQAERFPPGRRLRVKTNAPYSDTERWLKRGRPEDPDGVQLVLHLTDELAQAFRSGQPRAGPAGHRP